MQAVIDFFAQVGSIISTVINFVIKLFADLISMLEMLGNFFVALPSYFSWLPGAVVSSLVVIFSIVIIYKILGREG